MSPDPSSLTNTTNITNITPPSITGDIILFYQPKKNINLIIQSIIRLSRARHSHAAISISDFSLIHATPGNGVCIESLGDYLNKNKNFVVYRSKAALQESKLILLKENLQHYNLQKYSLLNTIFSSWRHSFCSELAAKAYEKSGLQLTKKNRKPKTVMPIDIYDYVKENPSWVNVTDEYRKFFLNPEYLEISKKVTDIERAMVECNQIMGYGQQALADKINYIRNKNGEAPPVIPPMNYWSNHLASRQGLWFSILFVFTYWARMIKEGIQLLWNFLIRPRR